MSSNATGDRCHTLLAEFLQERSDRRRANAQETEETTQSREINNSRKIDQVTLPEDLLFKIFILIPAESLYRIQFVCKKWFSLINCSNFISNHARKSETVLICPKLALSSLPFDEKPKHYFHFMDLEHGSDNFVKSNLTDNVDILANCDGLILTKMKNKTLIITNPVTRKHTELPSGTGAGLFNDSYSLAFCNEAKTYKVVHLLYKSVRYIGCEIMSISTTREWKTIDGPSSDLLRLCDIKRMPVSIDGSLYWMPRRNGCDYLVLMNLDNEKFVTKELPITCTVNDQLVEIVDVLGLVTHATHPIMEVWILSRCGDSKDHWVKIYSINLTKFDYGSPIAICSSRNGKEMVFVCHEKLYVYHYEKGKMKLIYSRFDPEEWYDKGTESLYIPHRNTLASW